MYVSQTCDRDSVYLLGAHLYTALQLAVQIYVPWVCQDPLVVGSGHEISPLVCQHCTQHVGFTKC